MCNQKGLFASSAILSIVSFAFFLIGVIGYSENKNVVTDIPWGVGEYEGFGGNTGDFYLGLQGYVVDSNGVELKHVSFNDDACTADFCDTCTDAGAVAFALCVVSVILSLAAFIFNVMGAVNGSIIASAATLICSVAAAVLSIIAFVSVNPCFNEFVDDVALSVLGSAEATYGIAGWLTLIGFILSAMSAILNAFTFCVKTAAGQGAAEFTAAGTEMK